LPSRGGCGASHRPRGAADAARRTTVSTKTQTQGTIPAAPESHVLCSRCGHAVHPDDTGSYWTDRSGRSRAVCAACHIAATGPAIYDEMVKDGYALAITTSERERARAHIADQARPQPAMPANAPSVPCF